MFIESKSMVAERMYCLFRECSAFQDLTDVEYIESGGREVVTLSFIHHNSDGTTWIEKRDVNVTADSGCAMIHDVWKYMWSRI